MLFRGTVFQNVANGLSDEQTALSEEKLGHLIREACVASNAHDFIEKLPNVSIYSAVFQYIHLLYRVITLKLVREQAHCPGVSGKELPLHEVSSPIRRFCFLTKQRAL